MSKRITVKQGEVALVLPVQLASELRGLLQTIRRGKMLPIRTGEISPALVKDIAGDVLLAMLDNDQWLEILGIELVKTTTVQEKEA